MATVKVLLAGPCDGHLGALYKRIQTVNAKSGPFQVLFCVGRFFSEGSADAEPDAEAVDYVTRTEAVSVPTYCIGGYGKGSSMLVDALKASSSGITYLGRAGVTEVHGLNVAFLDGKYDAGAYNSSGSSAAGSPHYSRADVDQLKAALQQMDGEVDLLLTCEWPQGLLGGVPKNLVPSEPCSAEGSAMAAELAQLARPRYHIAAGHPIFYSRPPYVSKDLGAGVRATRFVALAQVGNPGKQKFLHALGLAPASSMTPEQLAQQPEGCTPSPYELAAKRPASAQEDFGGQDWRWQGSKKQRLEPAVPLGRPGVTKDDRKTVFVGNVPFAAGEAELEGFFSRVGQVVDIRRALDDNGRPRSYCHVQFGHESEVQQALKLHGGVLLGRELRVDVVQGASIDKSDWGKAVDSCWFCMSSAGFDAELVASIGDAAYLTLDKGPITPNHVLLVPIEHYPSVLSLGQDAGHEVDRYLSALKSYYAASGEVLVGFERHLRLKTKGGNHCHINALGVPQKAGDKARKVFEEVAGRYGVQLVHLPAGDGPEAQRAALREHVGEDEYFLGLLPDGSQLVHRISRGERLPMNLGREILAELAACPHRADWKACTVDSPAQEAANTAAFKAKFKPYDAVMQE